MEHVEEELQPWTFMAELLAEAAAAEAADKSEGTGCDW